MSTQNESVEASQQIESLIQRLKQEVIMHIKLMIILLNEIK